MQTCLEVKKGFNSAHPVQYIIILKPMRMLYITKITYLYIYTTYVQYNPEVITWKVIILYTYSIAFIFKNNCIDSYQYNHYIYDFSSFSNIKTFFLISKYISTA